MTYLRMKLTCAALLCVGWPALGLAQGYSGGMVSGTGTVVLKRQPELVRLQVEVSAKGKTLKDALTALKARNTAVTTKLSELGAVKESVKFSDPKFTAVSNDRQRQMEMMVRQRIQERGKKAPKAEVPPVSISSTVTAEWAIKPATPEEVLIAGFTLSERIKAADLAGTKEKQTLTPEEEELAEESAQMMDQYGDRGQQPGEPMLFYVAKISKEDKAKALSDAFARAKTEAGQLSKAAGSELGALRQLMSSTYSDNSYDQYGGYDNRTAYMNRILARQADANQDGSAEALGYEPGTVTLPLTVVAGFDLK